MKKANGTYLIGLIQLWGVHEHDILERAERDMRLYEEAGMDGAIVVNREYGGDESLVDFAVETILKSERKIPLGVCVLPNHKFPSAFEIADRHFLDYVHISAIAGVYGGSYTTAPAMTKKDYLKTYRKVKSEKLKVLGGIWPDGSYPAAGSRLEDAVKESIERTNALVVTGEGPPVMNPAPIEQSVIRVENPLERIMPFRKIIDSYKYGPKLFVEDGVNAENIRQIMPYVDGFLVGKCFRYGNNPSQDINPSQLKRFMAAARGC